MRLQQVSPVFLEGDDLDAALRAVADFTDLKSIYLVGHSSGVARLAARPTTHLSLPASDARDVERAALVHDLGRVGVSAGIWGKVAPLSAGDWEQIRLHPYHSERLLSRSPYLSRLSTIGCSGSS